MKLSIEFRDIEKRFEVGTLREDIAREINFILNRLESTNLDNLSDYEAKNDFCNYKISEEPNPKKVRVKAIVVPDNEGGIDHISIVDDEVVVRPEFRYIQGIAIEGQDLYVRATATDLEFVTKEDEGDDVFRLIYSKDFDGCCYWGDQDYFEDEEGYELTIYGTL